MKRKLPTDNDENESAYTKDVSRHISFRINHLYRRDGYRESSVTSSRFSTPTPSQMRDQELNDGAFYGASPYDEYGPYDVGVSSGPSRPAPLPYDDPYQDVTPSSYDSSEGAVEGPSPQRGSRGFANHSSRERGSGRGHGRGRGRGRGREGSGRAGFDHRSGNGQGPSRRASFEPRDRRSSFNRGGPPRASATRSLSPASLAIARATGQYADGSAFAHENVPPSPSSMNEFWRQQHYHSAESNDTSYHSYGTSQNFYNSQQPYAQPHINPRFAAMFGIDVTQMQGQQYGPFGLSSSSLPSPYSPHSPDSLWTNSTWTPNTSVGTGQHQLPVSEHAVQTKTENDEYRP